MKLGTRVWGLITVVVIMALLAGGYFLGVAPLLDQQAKANSERQDAVAVNEGLEAEITKLRAAEKRIDDYESLAADYEALVPRTVESQRFIRTLDGLAAANGVTISEIKIDAFVPYSAPSADGDTAVDDLAPPPYTNPKIDERNFVIVPFSVTIEGAWAESLAFVNRLQFGDRLVLYTSIEQEATDTAYSTIIEGYMYVLIRPGDPVPGQEIVEKGGDAETPGSANDPTPSDASTPTDSPTPSDAETPTARG